MRRCSAARLVTSRASLTRIRESVATLNSPAFCIGLPKLWQSKLRIKTPLEAVIMARGPAPQIVSEDDEVAVDGNESNDASSALNFRIVLMDAADIFRVNLFW